MVAARDADASCCSGSIATSRCSRSCSSWSTSSRSWSTGSLPIRGSTPIVPFRSAYRPLWLGLGAVAFDLLIAVIVTSLLRGRLGYRTWRAVHWMAYGLWAVAVFHGLGIGSDSKQLWMLALVVVSVGAVAVAIVWRVAVGWPSWTPTR